MKLDIELHEDEVAVLRHLIDIYPQTVAVDHCSVETRYALKRFGFVTMEVQLRAPRWWKPGNPFGRGDAFEDAYWRVNRLSITAAGALAFARRHPERPKSILFPILRDLLSAWPKHVHFFPDYSAGLEVLAGWRFIRRTNRGWALTRDGIQHILRG